jgi:hypothetical protein
VTEEPQWEPDQLQPDQLDPHTPSNARMCDYFLGGSHNFEVDRQTANTIIDVMPDIVRIAKANRTFLRRIVVFAMSRGIRQFLDLGSGIPTEGNVHEIAAAIDASARVVYVDHDRTTVAYARTILDGDPNVAMIAEDILCPARIIDDPITRRLLDFRQPVAILMIGVGHFIEGDLPDVLAPIMRCAAPDSVLAISHAVIHPAIYDRIQADVVSDAYKAASTGLNLRTYAQIAAMFAGFPLVTSSPTDALDGRNLVPVNLWRPEPGTNPGTPIGGLVAGVGVRTDFHG